MAAPVSRKLLLGACFLGLVIIGELYAFSLDFQTRALVIRAHMILLIQAMFCFISKFLWKNLTNLKPTSAVIKNESRGWTPWQMVVLFYLVLSQLSYSTNLFFIGKDPHWFGMLTYSFLGSYIQLLTAMVFLKCVNFVVFYIKRKEKGARNGILSKRRTAVLAVLYAICAASYGLSAAAQVPQVKEESIVIKGLSSHWHKTRIVQLSDIHLGPTVGFSKLSAIVDVVNRLKPDIVVLTGDLVDGSVKSLSEAVAPLAGVKSRYGNFFVTGNHEYYTGDADNWLVKVKELGFIPLHNANVKLTPTGGSKDDVVCLAGADDVDAHKMRYTGHGFDVDASLMSCDPRHPVILLTHQPRGAKAALDSSYRVDLVLSGHTHGGQFFPMTIPSYLLNPFYAGLYRYGESSHVYVSQGTQYWGVPMRLGTTMEITLITLLSQS